MSTESAFASAVAGTSAAASITVSFSLSYRDPKWRLWVQGGMRTCWVRIWGTSRMKGYRYAFITRRRAGKPPILLQTTCLPPRWGLLIRGYPSLWHCRIIGPATLMRGLGGVDEECTAGWHIIQHPNVAMPVASEQRHPQTAPAWFPWLPLP